MNVTFSIKSDAEKIRALLCFNGKSRVTSKEYDKQYFKVNLDICDLSKGMLGVFFNGVIKSLIQQHSNFIFECPIKGGSYYAKDVPTIEDDQLPTRVLGFTGPFQLIFVARGNFNKAKAINHIITAKLFGSIQM